jgi:serine/threonine kinase 32
MKAVENIIQERRLLEEVDYPLICNLRFAFQDDENMFMVIDLMLGGDLRFHLDRQGSLKENMVQFYVAEVGLGLHYLHERKIVHRYLIFCSHTYFLMSILKKFYFRVKQHMDKLQIHVD